MLYALLIVSLVVFYICGYRLMARLDRFLGSDNAVERKRDKCFSFDKCHYAWRRVKKHLPKKSGDLYLSKCRSAFQER